MSGTPTSKSTQATRILKQAIENRTWEGYLPSERTLAEKLSISRSCLRHALEKLTSSGYIQAPNRSKRRQILYKPNSKKHNQLKQIVILTPTSEIDSPVTTLVQFSELRSVFSKTQLEFTILSPAFYNHPNVTNQTLLDFTASYPNTQWVLHQCPEHVQRWFDQSKLPCIILGSRFPGISIPLIDVDFRSACRHATGSLIAQGHRNLALIRYRTDLAGDERALEGMLDAIETSSYASKIPEPTILRHNFNGDHLAQSLTQLYSSAKPPSAIICINDHHYITTLSHLLHSGIKVPEDVSLICLTDNPQLKFLQPTPSYYSTGNKRTQALTKLFLSKDPHADKLIIPSCIQGSSVTPKLTQI